MQVELLDLRSFSVERQEVPIFLFYFTLKKILFIVRSAKKIEPLTLEFIIPCKKGFLYCFEII